MKSTSLGWRESNPQQKIFSTSLMLSVMQILHKQEGIHNFIYMIQSKSIFPLKPNPQLLCIFLPGFPFGEPIKMFEGFLSLLKPTQLNDNCADVFISIIV